MPSLTIYKVFLQSILELWNFTGGTYHKPPQRGVVSTYIFQQGYTHLSWRKTLPKAQQTWGLSSYHKFLHKTWSDFIFRISTKQQLQNLDQTSSFQLKLKFKILTKPSFRISNIIQLHNHYKTSASKYCPNPNFKSCLNFNFKILTKPCAQTLNKSLALWPNLSFQICNKKLPTRS